MSQWERDKSMTERIPDELVDQFFDRELDEGSREHLFGRLRHDVKRCEEVAKTQRMISMLREPIEAPDLTGHILDRMDRQRRFLPARLRGMVKASRVAVAACLLMGVVTVALIRRYEPSTLRLVDEPQPLSGVIESSKTDAAGAKHLADSIVVLSGRDLEKPVRAQPPHGAVAALSPGKTSAFTLPRTGVDALKIPAGAGTESRFVFMDGKCVDRATSQAIALGFGPARALPGDCVEGPEVYVVRLMEMMGLNEGEASTGTGTGAGPGAGSPVAREIRR